MLTVIPVIYIGSNKQISATSFNGSMGIGYFALGVEDYVASNCYESLAVFTDSKTGIVFKPGLGVDFNYGADASFSISMDLLIANTEEENTIIFMLNAGISLFN